MILIANERKTCRACRIRQAAPVILGCEGKKLALYNGALAPPPAAADCLKR